MKNAERIGYGWRVTTGTENLAGGEITARSSLQALILVQRLPEVNAHRAEGRTLIVYDKETGATRASIGWGDIVDDDN